MGVMPPQPGREIESSCESLEVIADQLGRINRSLQEFLKRTEPTFRFSASTGSPSRDKTILTLGCWKCLAVLDTERFHPPMTCKHGFSCHACGPCEECRVGEAQT